MICICSKLTQNQRLLNHKFPLNNLEMLLLIKINFLMFLRDQSPNSKLSESAIKIMQILKVNLIFFNKKNRNFSINKMSILKRIN